MASDCAASVESQKKNLSLGGLLPKKTGIETAAYLKLRLSLS